MAIIYNQKKVMCRTSGHPTEIELINVVKFTASSVWRYDTDCDRLKRYNRIGETYAWHDLFTGLNLRTK